MVLWARRRCPRGGEEESSDVIRGLQVLDDPRSLWEPCWFECQVAGPIPTSEWSDVDLLPMSLCLHAIDNTDIRVQHQPPRHEHRFCLQCGRTSICGHGRGVQQVVASKKDRAHEGAHLRAVLEEGLLQGLRGVSRVCLVRCWRVRTAHVHPSFQ